MKLMLSGLSPETDVDKLRERMSHFGPVISIDSIHEGNPDQPWFIVELDLSAGAANEVARRIDGIYFHGRFVRARVLPHA